MGWGFRVAPRAAAQIRDAAGWWAENRPKAPDAFLEDVEAGFDMIQRLPGAGQRVEHPRIEGIRRIVLTRVRYVLYYRVAKNERVVEVLALWHASKGSQPDLG